MEEQCSSIHLGNKIKKDILGHITSGYIMINKLKIKEWEKIIYNNSTFIYLTIFKIDPNHE